jgi:hypothetical protein
MSYWKVVGSGLPSNNPRAHLVELEDDTIATAGGRDPITVRLDGVSQLDGRDGYRGSARIATEIHAIQPGDWATGLPWAWRASDVT